MTDMKLTRILIIIANVFALAVIGGSLLAFKKLAKPVIQGYYCDDDSIDKPYRPSTIPFIGAGMVYLVVSFLCFTYAECCHVNTKDLELKEKIKSVCLSVFLLLVFYFYGSGITMFITNVGKYTVGRLRPHFLDVCRPDWSRINCTNAVGAKNYIVGNQFCTNMSSKVFDARVSFPSGHSSFTMYCSVFLVLFLERRDYFRYNQWGIMPKLLVQTLIGSSGLYVGLSRISDFKHHVTDVVAGFILGIAIAIFMHISAVKFMPAGWCTNDATAVPTNDEGDTGKVALTVDEGKDKAQGENVEKGRGKNNIWL